MMCADCCRSRDARTFRKGEVVFHRGDSADSLHLISKGRFKVQVLTPFGEPATIAIRAQAT